MTLNLANRLEFDFDAMPQEVASALASSIEKFIYENHPEVRLHGGCSLLDENSLNHEVSFRSALRGAMPRRHNNLPSTEMVKECSE